MRIATGQNTFANHYKHMEEFEKYLIRTYERLREKAEVSISPSDFVRPADPMSKNMERRFLFVDSSCYRQLYIRIYPRSTKGDYVISSVFLTKLENYIFSFFRACDTFNSLQKDKWSPAVKGICDEMEKFRKDNYLLFSPDMKFDSIRALANSLKASVSVLDLVLKYDPHYIPSVWVEKVLRTDFEILPDEPLDRMAFSTPVNVRRLLMYSETAFQ
ncbi:hypothetical protein BN2497_4097 [Janthinobacterium sp. CG23_2]|nr:hypothetical protein BN2497_4097 [Janthinobacterium sp. CG23_2]CUU28446.1 hypothetical protein BN3177_4097 [Janthinobacterium sp. CG23_2]